MLLLLTWERVLSILTKVATIVKNVATIEKVVATIDTTIATIASGLLRFKSTCNLRYTWLELMIDSTLSVVARRAYYQVNIIPVKYKYLMDHMIFEIS